MRNTAIVLPVLALAAAACRSPFANDWEDSGPPEDPQKIGVGVHGWPVYERDPNRLGVRTDVLWPLSSVRVSPEGDLRRASFLVPIVLIEKDGTRDRFGVRPLFDVETDSDPSHDVEDVDLLFPLVKWRHAPEESRFEVRPLWFSGHERDEDWTIFAPFGGDWKTDRNSGWFAGPFAGSWTDHEKTTDWWAAGLLAHDHDESKSLDGWWGLLGLYGSKSWSDGSEWRLFPIAEHSEDTSSSVETTRWIWPGLAGRHRRSDETTTWAAPLFYREADDDGDHTTVVLPFWYSSKSGDESVSVLFPIYGEQDEPRLHRTFWGGTLWIDTDREGGGATDILWPMFHASTEPDGWDARLFPVFWAGSDATSSYTHLWPLYGTETTGTRTERGVAWPFFTVTTDDDGWEAELPAPFVKIDRRGTRHETAIRPVFSHESNPEKGTYEGDVLWLLSNWEGHADGSSDFRVLWRLVQATDSGGRSVFAVNPLFRHETNARGDDHWSTLFGLIARTQEAGDVRWRFLWFLEI